MTMLWVHEFEDSIGLEKKQAMAYSNFIQKLKPIFVEAILREIDETKHIHEFEIGISQNSLGIQFAF